MSRAVSNMRIRKGQSSLRQCWNHSSPASASCYSTTTMMMTMMMINQSGESGTAERLHTQRTRSHHQLRYYSYSYSYSFSSMTYSSPLSSTSTVPVKKKQMIVLPTTTSTSTSSTSASASNNNNSDHAHYLNPWDTSSKNTTLSVVVLPPIEEDVRLDRQTRFLIQLLQEQKMHGLRNPRFHRKSIPESLTIEKCHYWLQQLAIAIESSTGTTGTTGTTTSLSLQCWQRAERGRMILEHMESIAHDYHQYYYYSSQPNQRQSTANNDGGIDDSMNGRDPSSKKALVLPLPTSETYLLVLKLYATKYLHGDATVPETCRAIVERMQQNAFAQIVEPCSDGAGQDEPITPSSSRIILFPMPTTQHWNQVIIAWANSKDEKRPIYAAQIAHALDTLGMADASTFSHALRACVCLDSRQQVPTPEFVQLALPVAQRLQSGLLARQQQQQDTKENESSIPLEAYHIVHLLRVARNLLLPLSRKRASNTTEKEKQENDRNAMIRNAWQLATSHQKVNVHVLQELIHVASPKLVQELILVEESEKGNNEESSEDSAISPTILKDPLQLIQVLPKEWIDHSTPDQDPYQW